MKFFDDLRADRLIEEIRSKGDIQHPEVQKALGKLARLGTGGIPKIVEALPAASKQETLAFVEILTQLLDQKTFPMLMDALVNGDSRTNAALSWALSSSRNFPPNLLLEQLSRPGMPRPVVLEVINAHKARFNLRDLLNQAYNQESTEKAALFKIIGEIADEHAVPELISRMEGKDTVARTHIVNILSRFDRPDVARSMQRLLKDPNKLIRQAALNALVRMKATVEIEPVCQLLSDGDIEVQNKAVELIIRAKDPQTMKYLVPVLKDENEYSRRAAVEVLNALGTSKDIKQLLQVIKDDDWWVRSRAADALGKIGGPRVVDAVLELVRDEDEEVRRAAIEILNQTKDERAVNFLIDATKDKDWWVAERAVDALAEIGSKKAVPALIEMANGSNVRAFPAVARALGKIGDPRGLEALTKLLTHGERETKIEAVNALARVADERRADSIRTYIQSATQGSNDDTLIRAAEHALEDLDGRYSTASVAAQQKTANVRMSETRSTETAKTLLIEKADISSIVKSAEETAQAAKLDINTLKPGDLIEGRYKYIEKIGKGAFGTVLLVEDSVVEERLILKFLNSNVAQDEEMMKRFVHELRYSRKITHKNVIRIYDFVYMRGLYAISMEYFPSHPLGSEIVNDKPLATQQAVRYGCDIATGMAVAHLAGIVHRDLKPANILVNSEKFLKVVDFGVAAAHKEGDTQLTKTGYVIGSPKYMAPEQILGKKVDERADIYSLGVILYEMLTGVPPYSRGDHMSVMYQHVQGKAKAPIDVNPQLPKELSELVVKAMSVDKMKRHQSMDELRLALEKFL
ncbi:MAG: HEAT repeat domain-containing protein [Steroidobacteraceae bacterium]